MSQISSLFHQDQIEFSTVPPTISHSSESNSLRHDDLFQLVDFVKDRPISELWTLRHSTITHPLPTHINSNGTTEANQRTLLNSISRSISRCFSNSELKQETHTNIQIPQAPQTIVKFHRTRLITAVIYNSALQIYSKPLDSLPYHQIFIDNPTSIQWVPLTNDTLLVGTQSGPLLYTRLESTTPLVTPLVYPQHNNIQDVAINRQGVFAATLSTSSPYLIVWDLVNQIPQPQPLLMNEKPHHIIWSPNGKYLAIVQYDQITLLDPVSFETYPVSTDVIHCIAWSPDSQSLIYSSPNEKKLKIIQVIHLASHIQLAQLTSVSLDSIQNFKPPVSTKFNIESISINGRADLALGYSGKSSQYPNVHLLRINLDYINYYSTIRNQIFEFVREFDYDPIVSTDDRDDFSGSSNFFSTAYFHPTVDNELWAQYGDRTLKRFSF